MTDEIASSLPETWLARAGCTFLVVRASADGKWTWEILVERVSRPMQTIAQGGIHDVLDSARRAAEDEAERLGLLSQARRTEKPWK